MTVSTKNPATMTAAQINAEKARLDAGMDRVLSAMIAAGRGHEVPTETRKLSDPLSLDFAAIADRLYALRCEIHARTGQNWSELPIRRGRLSFGPRVRSEAV